MKPHSTLTEGGFVQDVMPAPQGIAKTDRPWLQASSEVDEFVEMATHGIGLAGTHNTHR